MLPHDFNPVGFLYLNPEFDVDISEAADVYMQQLSLGNTLCYNLTGMIPSDFDAEMFLSCHNSGILDVSHLNMSISLHEGWRSARLVNTIMREGVCETIKEDTSFIIKFLDDDFEFLERFLSQGDVLELEFPTEITTFTIAVTHVDYHNRFFEGMIIHNNKQPANTQQSVIVKGHWLHDPERLARINFVRGNAPSVTVDGRFNAELYKLLYPDVRRIGSNELELFRDYMKRTNRGDFRIGMVDDLERIVHTPAPSKKTVRFDKPVHISLDDENTEIALDVKGSVRATEFLNTSDVRLKRDVTELQGDWCTSIIKGAIPIQYAFKDCATKNKHYGFRAQDLEKVDPNLVKSARGHLPNIMKDIDIGRFGDVFLESHGLSEGDIVVIRTATGEETPVTIRKVFDTNTFVIGNLGLSNSRATLCGHQADDILSVDYGNVMGIVVGALHDVLKRLESLELRLSTLGLA
jgi:hypothetical protein